MPAKAIILLLLLPAMLYASEENAEQDLELFEFLASFEPQDDFYLDVEIKNAEIKHVQNNVSQKVIKSKHDE